MQWLVVLGNDYYNNILICIATLYDTTRVRVCFQDNAWCDEQIMREWIMQQWKPACSGYMLLALDIHKAQATEAIQDCLKEQCNTYPVYVPSGTTNIVQPIDAPFKAAVERHLQGEDKCK